MDKNNLLEQIRLAEGTDDFVASCTIVYQILEELHSDERLEMLVWFLQMAEDYYFSKKDIVPPSKNLSDRLNGYSLKYKKLVVGLIDLFSSNGYTEKFYYEKIWDGLNTLLSDATDEEKGYCLYTIAFDRRTPYYEMPLGLKLSDEKHKEIVDTVRFSMQKAAFVFSLSGVYKTETTSRMIHLLEELDSIEQKSVFLAFLFYRIEQEAVENSKRVDDSTPATEHLSNTTKVEAENKDTTFLPVNIQGEGNEVDSSELIESYSYPDLNGNQYCFALKKRGEDVYITDQGKTLEQLNEIFELSEPDVVRNLETILNQYGVIKQGDEFIVKINKWDGNANEDLEKGKLSLFSCVSFMLNMKIFFI